MKAGEIIKFDRKYSHIYYANNPIMLKLFTEQPFFVKNSIFTEFVNKAKYGI